MKQSNCIVKKSVKFNETNLTWKNIPANFEEEKFSNFNFSCSFNTDNMYASEQNNNMQNNLGYFIKYSH